MSPKFFLKGHVTQEHMTPACVPKEEAGDVSKVTWGNLVTHISSPSCSQAGLGAQHCLLLRGHNSLYQLSQGAQSTAPGNIIWLISWPFSCSSFQYDKRKGVIFISCTHRLNSSPQIWKSCVSRHGCHSHTAAGAAAEAALSQSCQWSLLCDQLCLSTLPPSSLSDQPLHPGLGERPMAI